MVLGNYIASFDQNYGTKLILDYIHLNSADSAMHFFVSAMAVAAAANAHDVKVRRAAIFTPLLFPRDICHGRDDVALHPPPSTTFNHSGFRLFIN